MSTEEANMPDRDDFPGPWRESERDGWHREAMREQRVREAREQSAFDQDQSGYGQDAWRRDRYARRFEQDRMGRRYADAGSAGYRRRDAELYGDTSLTHGGEPYAYGGQEYGIESHHGEAGRGFDRGSERRSNFDYDDPGVGQSQAGYGGRARSHPEEFDSDYLRWRNEQLRAHDRDYQDWRREQQRRYDEQYRQYRNERQRRFGEAFHEWRSRRILAGGALSATIGGGYSAGRSIEHGREEPGPPQPAGDESQRH
jgi:hypothetical protein